MRLKSKLVAALSAATMALAMSMPAGALETAVELVENASNDAWRDLDPENVIFMDLPSGRITIELRPDIAPAHVARIKQLTREGFYNGIIFHRVIEGFMAQGGDPTGTGMGSSKLPDLAGEFYRDEPNVSNFIHVGRDARAARVGFIGPIPFGAEPETLNQFLVDGETKVWGLHCQGVMSMARGNAEDSANSQFFLMFSDARRSLDKAYTVWGRIVDGGENSRRISRGEPPKRPTPIVRMRVAADVPLDERDELQVLRTDTEVFQNYLKLSNAVSEDGYVDDICNVAIPKKVNGKVEF